MSTRQRPLSVTIIGALCLALTAVGCAEDTGGNSGGGGASSASVDDFAVNVSVCGHARLDLVRNLYLGLSLAFDALPASSPHSTVFNDLLQCVGSAGDCHAVWSCLNVDTTQECEPVTDSCDGTSEVGCVTVDGCGSSAVGWREETDCAAQDTIPSIGDNDLCITDDFGQPACGAGTCDSDYEICDAEVLERCSFGVIERTDCASLGGVCTGRTNDGGDTELACVLESNPECDEDRCEDGLYVDCENGREVLRYDCGLVAEGLSCVTEQDGPVCRTLEAAECEEDEVVCVGDEARWCLNGRWAKVDCSAFMGSTCAVEDSDNPFMGDHIYCTNAAWNTEVDALDGEEGNAWDNCP